LNESLHGHTDRSNRCGVFFSSSFLLLACLSQYRRTKAATKSVEGTTSLVQLTISPEEFNSLYHPKTWPNKIMEAKEWQAQILEQQKTAMIEVLEKDVAKFERYLDGLSEEAEACKLLDDVSSPAVVVVCGSNRFFVVDLRF
jgi:hypothetical protein